MAAVLEFDLDICPDDEVGLAMEILLAEVRTTIKAEERFTPRPQKPPEVEDADDPDWEW